MQRPHTYRLLTAALTGALCILTAPAVHALGTPSGTDIVNTVTASYSDGGTPVTRTATATITVDNKVNLTVAMNAEATVIPGATDQALLFVLRNDGNTPQRYALTATSGGGITLDNVRIYLDNGTLAGTLDAGDTLYVDPSTFGDIPADGTLNLLMVADVPAGASSGQTADYNLLATSVTAGTTTVTAPTVGAGTAGVDVVFADIAGSDSGDAARDGQHSAAGRFSINALALAINKTVTIVSDPFNGTANPKAIPGATLRYDITVTVSGSGTAAGVVISDPIPSTATYTANTLRLNGAPLSDTSGDDSGSIGGTPTALTVTLGDMTSTTPAQVISFDVTIN